MPGTAALQAAWISSCGTLASDHSVSAVHGWRSDGGLSDNCQAHIARPGQGGVVPPRRSLTVRVSHAARVPAASDHLCHRDAGEVLVPALCRLEPGDLL